MLDHSCQLLHAHTLENACVHRYTCGIIHVHSYTHTNAPMCALTHTHTHKQRSKQRTEVSWLLTAHFAGLSLVKQAGQAAWGWPSVLLVSATQPKETLLWGPSPCDLTHSQAHVLDLSFEQCLLCLCYFEQLVEYNLTPHLFTSEGFFEKEAEIFHVIPRITSASIHKSLSFCLGHIMSVPVFHLWFIITELLILPDL